MMQHLSPARLDAALRVLDPAAGASLTPAEADRAARTLEQVLAAPRPEQEGHAPARPRRRRTVVVAGLLAATGLAAPTVLGGGAVFASWSRVPVALAPATSEAAATTCRESLDVADAELGVALGEQRGGWTYVLLQGRGGEAACLMPEDAVGSTTSRRPEGGLLATLDSDPPTPPATARDGLVETESMTGSVEAPGRLGIGSREAWLTWVNGYVGRDVVGVTVRPPSGPAVEASVVEGRFSAWWPSGDPRVGAAWTYTVTLADGSTRQVDGRG